MKRTLTPRQKKWIKRLLVLLVIRLVLGAILYYVVVYRFKDIVQLMVKRESGGLYAFDASEVDFSLWRKNIVVTGGMLHCTDTLRRPTHYEARVPQIYLGIESWTALIFHRRMLVDSLHIAYPTIRAHAHAEMLEKKRQVTFHASRIFDVLQYLVAHLQVRTFALQNGSFVYSNTRNEIAFVSDRINLSIRDFSRKEGPEDHLFSTSDIDLTIGRQRWLFPDGRHAINFSSLHFSGKDQLFELDTCSFHSNGVGEVSEMTLSADKIFFNSRKLSAMYEQEKLLLDTLICIRPVLTMRLAGMGKAAEDSVRAGEQVRKTLFRFTNIKYIEMRSGRLRLLHAAQANAVFSPRANLLVYNFRVYPDSADRVRTDSVLLNRKNIKLIGRDSLIAQLGECGRVLMRYKFH